MEVRVMVVGRIVKEMTIDFLSLALCEMYVCSLRLISSADYLLIIRVEEKRREDC